MDVAALHSFGAFLFDTAIVWQHLSGLLCHLSLDEAVRDSSIQPQDLICLPVFGGGLTWGSALIEW